MAYRTVYVRPIHADIWAELDELSASTGMSSSVIIAWALADWLRQHKGGADGPPATPVRLPRLPPPDQK